MDAKAVEPVTVLKTRSADLIRRARETGRPIIITQNGRATAVLQDVDTFQRQRDALLLVTLFCKGTEEIRAGHGIADAEARRRIEARLAELEGA